MKFQRQAAIIDLISNYEIDTQEELTARLREKGFNSTQATVSRDIKELRLIKDSGFAPRMRNIFRECVVKVDVAQNLVVLKTITGMANAAAAALDSMKIGNIIGTIAGDDNVLIILKDNETAQRFFEETHEMLRSAGPSGWEPQDWMIQESRYAAASSY